jgi:uncharacterized protein
MPDCRLRCNARGRTSLHMRQEISRSLAAVEAEHGIRVLYACESGSRAWGFASRDSDWDVRFFFVRPQREYLRVQIPADQIHRDLPGDLDMTGWDVRKALHHVAKSGASVFEWLGSPVVYVDRDGFASELRRLARDCFRVRPAVHHYLGLAKQLWPQAGGDEAELNGKKCLYVMRATLCARWCLMHGTPPPVAFAELLPLVGDAALREEILRFVALKTEGSESDAFPVSGRLREFLTATRAACDAAQADLAAAAVDLSPLDAFFQRTLSAWS